MKKARFLLCLLSLAFSAHASEPHWTWCGWGGGGWFWSSAADPADGDVFYMGGDVDGIWKTEDAGRSWRFVNRGLGNYAVYSLAVAPGDGRYVYALTGNGVCASTNGAASWVSCAQTASGALAVLANRGGSIHALAVAPNDPEIVYAGGASGRAVKSTDGGKTWKTLRFAASEPSGAPVCTIAVSGRDANVVLLCEQKLGLFRSTDAGATWSAVSGAPAKARSVYWAGPEAPKTWYGAFDSNGVCVSKDDGLTWTALGAPSSGRPARDVACSRQDPSVIHAVFTSGYNSHTATSRDGGITWKSVSKFSLDHAANPTLPGNGSTGSLSGIENICVSPVNADNIHIPGNWDPCFSRDAGASWVESCKGADITCFHDIRFLDGAAYGAAMDEGTCMSADGGAQWSALFPLQWTEGLSGHHWRVLPQKLANGKTRIISTVSPWAGAQTYPVKVIVSEDGGKSFSVATGLPDYRPTANTMWGEGHGRALAADPTDPDILYLGIDGDPENGKCGGGVFKSTDGGKSWKQLANQPGSRRMFYGLAVDPTNPQRIVWGACGDNSGVYVSEDGGSSWTKAAGLGDWIYNVEITPSGVIYASGNQLYRSTDHGKSFSTVSSYTCGGTVMGIAVDPNDENRIWTSVAGWDNNATGGVFETTDGCRTWTEITGDIPNRKPVVVRYDAESGYLWAAGPAAFKLQVDKPEPEPEPEPEPSYDITVAPDLGTVQHEGVLDVWTNMVITVGAGSRYVVKQVTGTATLTKRGEGTLVFEGSGSSRQAGETIVAEGTIEFGEHQSWQLGNRVTIGGEGKPAVVILTSTRAWATDIFHWMAPGTFTVKDQGVLDFTRNTHAVEIRAISAIRVEKGGRFERGSWTLNANAKVSYEEPPAPVIGTAGAAPALVTAAGGGSVFRVPVTNAQAGCLYAVYVTEDLTQPFQPSGISVQAKSDGRLDLDIPTAGKPSLFVQIRASTEP